MTSAAQGLASTCRPSWLPGQCDIHALHSFYEHADSSNDIFRVAARAVAVVASAFYMRIAVGGGVAPREQDSLLLEAWRPFQAVCKAVWWEKVPMPEDLEDEVAWRSQLKYASCARPGCRRRCHISPCALIKECLRQYRCRSLQTAFSSTHLHNCARLVFFVTSSCTPHVCLFTPPKRGFTPGRRWYP